MRDANISTVLVQFILHNGIVVLFVNNNICRENKIAGACGKTRLRKTRVQNERK